MNDDIRDIILASFANFGLFYNIRNNNWIEVHNDYGWFLFDIYFDTNNIHLFRNKKVLISYDSFSDVYEFMGLILYENYLNKKDLFSHDL